MRCETATRLGKGATETEADEDDRRRLDPAQTRRASSGRRRRDPLRVGSALGAIVARAVVRMLVGARCRRRGVAQLLTAMAVPRNLKWYDTIAAIFVLLIISPPGMMTVYVNYILQRILQRHYSI